MLTRPGLMRQTLGSCQGKGREAPEADKPMDKRHDRTAEERLMEQRRLEDEDRTKSTPRKLFDGVTVYVNGSTFPLVSDHRLKQIISENGGDMALHLGRRRVTHVILGRPSSGGGLAAGKLEREIRKTGGSGVKFVGAEW